MKNEEKSFQKTSINWDNPTKGQLSEKYYKQRSFLNNFFAFLEKGGNDE